jgi:hypothetical protein
MLLVFLGGRREENGHSGQVPGLGQGNRAHQNITHCARGGHTGTILYININKAQCTVNIYPGIQAMTTVKERILGRNPDKIFKGFSQSQSPLQL